MEQTQPVIPLPEEGGPDRKVVAAALQAELFRRGEMVATAESLTGGRLGDILSAAPGASDTYVGGVVTYATELKQKVLGVSDEIVEEHGVVSAECAAEMATGVRSLTGAAWAVSTTGVAGPATQEGKPVGLVFVGVAGPDGVTTKELHLDGERPEIKDKACVEAMSAVIERLTGVDP